MPTTTTSCMGVPAAFSAWIAPMAISSLLARIASIGRPEVIQFVVRSSALVRCQAAGCSSAMVAPLQSPAASVSLTDWVRSRVASCARSPIRI